jgi:hypothetical protein
VPSAAAAVDAALSALSARACEALRGPRSALAAARFGAPHLHARSLQENVSNRAITAGVQARFTAAAGAQRMWAAAVRASLSSSETAATSPAWVLSPAAAPPVDGCVALIGQVLCVVHAQRMRTARARTVAANGCLRPAEAVGFDEAEEVIAAVMQLVPRAGALLAHARSCATVDGYVATADAVLAACVSFAAGLVHALARRHEWMEEALRAEAAAAAAAEAAHAGRYLFVTDDSLHMEHLLAMANVPIA